MPGGGRRARRGARAAAPFGAKGIGEPPTISSTAAVVAAIRAATGRPPRVPVRPQDIALVRAEEGSAWPVPAGSDAIQAEGGSVRRD